MSRSTRVASFLLFMLGLGSATKIYLLGTISFSELAIFPIAPFLLIHDLARMKRDGVTMFLWMLSLLIGGMFASALWNHIEYPYIVKLFAVFYGWGAYFIVFYHLLRDNMKGLWWFFFGVGISEIITIWAFNPTAEISATGFAYIGEREAEDVIMGPLFWIGKLRGWGSLPIIGAYLKIPIGYSIITPILFVAFALFNTISGRAQSLCVILGSVIMFVGRKSRRTMRNIGRHFLAFLTFGILALIAYKFVYSNLASNGVLGEEARSKYEHQTARGKSALHILMAGRKEFFISAIAIKDSPIFGFGARAEDKKGYAQRFLLKYGSDEDIEAYNHSLYMALKYGIVRNIPTHSHIMAGWVWCGLPGLVFFLWLMYLMYRHIRFYLAAIPQMFGYFALTIPSMFWSMFFNPFDNRYSIPLLVVYMLFAKSIGDGRIQLAYDMEMEARKYD